MATARKEEQFPLLLFVVGEENDQLSKTNKGFRGRFNNITNGATTVITEWPNYVSSCWSTSFFCGTGLFILTLMLFSCMSMDQKPRLPRCAADTSYSCNKTVHLVSTSRSVNHEQLDFILAIIKNFPGFQVHFTVIEKRENVIPKTSVSPPNQTLIRNSSNIGIILQKIIDSLIKNKNLSKNNTEKVALDTYFSGNPSVYFDFYDSYDSVFQMTPIYMTWKLLSEEVKILTVRILQIWQYGGVSFDLTNTSATKQYVMDGGIKFEQMKDETVSIDPLGLHMATKLSCHAFFGRIIMKLRRARPHLSSESLLKGLLIEFCANKIIDNDYCKRYKQFY